MASRAASIPPVAAVDPRIVRVGAGGSFADAVARALALGPLTEDERLGFVDAHSWSRRHDQVLAVAFGPEMDG